MSPSAFLDQLRWDVRHALRTMKAEKAFTAFTILILALGIGATTAIFTVMNRLMLRDLPVRAPGDLVELLSRYPGEPRVNGFGWKVYEHYRDENDVFSELIGTSPAHLRVRGADGSEAGTIDGEYVTGTFFRALGLIPAAGRLIGPDDDRVGSAEAAVAVLSWACWKSRFAADPEIVGRRLVVENVPATVIGVAPRGFFGLQVGASPDAWLPVAMAPLIGAAAGPAPGDAGGLDRLGLRLMGRLRPGVSLEQARAHMSVLDRWRVDLLARRSQDPLIRQLKLELQPAAAGFSQLRDIVARPLLVLMTLAGLTLLIACTNLATMLLARGAARQRETAVRLSLGAGRWRLLRQTLTESLVTSCLAGVAGLLLASLGARALVRIFTSGRPFMGLPEHLDIPAGPDPHVLLFTAGAALLTGVAFGTVPAWKAFFSAPASLLRRTGETRHGRLVGDGLVVAQVVVSTVLLGAAGLFVRHLSNLRGEDLGFQSDSVLLVRLDTEGAGYTAPQLAARFKALLERFEAIPGVRAATLATATPASGAGVGRFVTVAGSKEAGRERRYVSVHWVGPRYFETLGIPLLAGRDFESKDEGRRGVAIINRAMARHYFGDSDPLGKDVTFDGEDQPYRVVGLVADARDVDVREEASRAIYLDSFQGRQIGTQFALRTAVPPLAVVPEVRSTVRDVAGTVRVGKVTTLSEQVDSCIVPERLLAALSLVFGALGFVLVASGLYGLLAYTVAGRTREIGVRMALGATSGGIAMMIVRSALGLALAGLVAGVPLALAAERLAGGLLGALVEGTPTILFAAAAIVGVALLAAYVPARRAARIEPMEALRCE